MRRCVGVALILAAFSYVGEGVMSKCNLKKKKKKSGRLMQSGLMENMLPYRISYKLFPEGILENASLHDYL